MRTFLSGGGSFGIGSWGSVRGNRGGHGCRVHFTGNESNAVCVARVKTVVFRRAISATAVTAGPGASRVTLSVVTLRWFSASGAVDVTDGRRRGRRTVGRCLLSDTKRER